MRYEIGVMTSSHPENPKNLPVPWRPRPSHPDISHHEREWWSGTRGGGSVPADFEWRTNPKQYQEERGSGADAPVRSASR